MREKGPAGYYIFTYRFVIGKLLGQAYQGGIFYSHAL
jgi:hypothetical protein